MVAHNKTYQDKACGNCGKVRPVREDNKARYCRFCAGKLFHPPPRRGENSPSWKGGRHYNGLGYVTLRIDGKRKLEHRLVMEQLIKRPLLPNEVVHHLNGIKDDNRKENLQLVVRRKHGINYTDGYRQAHQEALEQEYQFLDGILHLPFFEFCLQVKERKQAIGIKLGRREDAKM